MSVTVLEEIAQELASSDNDEDLAENQKTSFYAEDNLSSAELAIEVNDIGPLTFPLEKGTIENLIRIASKSRLGFRSQTITDESVRNSYEISKDMLHVTMNSQSLTRILQRMGENLGLTSGAKLTADLNNMLIYAPGHFFKTHQDTEKAPNMIATLVVVLPSPHIGGNLVIHLEKNEKHVVSTQNVYDTSVRCIGFYTDCLHELEEVTAGYRVALTYSLLLESPMIEADPEVNPRLRGLIKRYFDKKVKDREALLTIVLDHSYTEVGLRWNLLKGADRLNAASLLAVANDLHLLPYLALVELQEEWSYYPEFDGDREIGGERDDLQDTHASLKNWVDSSNRKVPFKEMRIEFEDQVCMRTGNEERQPFKTENNHEYNDSGGMNSSQYLTYNRAGVVLFPKSNELKMNFLLDNRNALSNLWVTSRNFENKSEVLEVIDNAGKYLLGNCHKSEAEDFDLLAEIAINLNEEEKALYLLEKFRWPILKTDIIDMFVSLQDQFGSSFCIGLLEKWYAGTKTNYSSSVTDYLLDNVDLLIEKLMDKGADIEIAQNILIKQCKAVMDEKPREMFSYYRTFKEKPLSILKRAEDVFKASARLNNMEVLQKMGTHVMQNPKVYPSLELSEMLLGFCNERDADVVSKLRDLAINLCETIGNKLIVGPQSKDDWSIKIPPQGSRCTCDPCRKLHAFLESKCKKAKEWRVNKTIRAHFVSFIRCMGLPLNYALLQNSPCKKLLLRKKSTMHQIADERFKRLGATYERLQRLLI